MLFLFTVYFKSILPPYVEKNIKELRESKVLTIKMVWEEYKNEHPYGLAFICQIYLTT